MPPPQPFPANLTIFGGESVDLPLRGVSRAGRSLKFLVRVPPKLGDLGEITVTGADSATVRYNHNPRAGLGEDLVRYAVQAPGSGVSASAEIRISVVDRPTLFVAPKRLDFPAVPVGESVTRTIEIRNDGGGMVSGQLSVEPPWTLPKGDGSYRLGPNASQEITIRFSPGEGRQYAATANFSHSVAMNLGLGGQGFAAVEVIPQRLTIEVEGSREARAGGFTLRNLTGQDRTLTITAPEQVVVQQSVQVPAKSEREVALHTAAGFLDPLEGEIQITGKNTNLKLPLIVRAAPPRLVADVPGGLNFGALSAGRTGRAAVALQNTGGSNADLRVTLPEGVTISPDPSLQPLEPGAIRKYEVRFAGVQPGKVSDQIVFHTGHSALDLAITAEVLRDSRTTAAPGGTAAVGGGTAAGSVPDAVYNDIPPVETVTVTRITRTEVDLAWKKTSPNVKRYLIAERKMGFLDNGKAYTVWRELKDAKARFVGSEARVTLAGRRAGEPFTISVTALDAAGVPSRSSPPFLLSSKPIPLFRVPWTGIGAVLVVLFGLLIVRERRRVNRAMTEEIERVSHL